MSVATPLRRCNRLSATRSPVSKCARGGRYACRDLSREEFLAVVKIDFRCRGGVQEAENFDEQIDPREDERRLGDHFAVRALRWRNDGFSGDIAAPISSARKDCNKL